MVLLLAIVALIAFMVACGTEPGTTSSNSQSGETTKTTNSLETYTDPDYGFTFEYPSGWQIKLDTSAELSAGSSAVKDVAVYDPKGAKVDGSPVNTAVISVYKLRTSVDETMMETARAEIDSVLREMESQDASWQRLEELTNTQLGAIPGFRINYGFSLDDTPAVTAMYFLFHKDTEYQLICQAVKTDWPKYQDEFTAILESFSVSLPSK